MYKVYEVENSKFYIKFDLINNEYITHMNHRQAITPETAIKAYFNKITDIYNEVNKRFEAYSEELNVSIFYTYRHNKDEEILIITAF